MEMEDLNKSKFNQKEINIINDYFSFDSDDIQLSYLKKNIVKNLKTHKLNPKHKEEAEMYFHEIMIIYEKSNFSDLTFPYLKHSLSSSLSTLKDRLENTSQKGYFLILLFSNLSKIRSKLTLFYYQSIKNHNLGLPKEVEGVINPDLFGSYHYESLIEKLTNWYVKNEFIYLFLLCLNDFFDVRINFDENDFSIEKNFEFSLKIFMKKSFYKLSSYLLNKLSVFSKSFFLNQAMATVNSKYLSLLLLSSLSFGISIKKFTGIDKKPFVFLAGFFLHYLMNSIADSLQKQSNYVEVDNLAGKSINNKEILRKLNKKIEKLRVGLFELIKANISEMMEIDECSKCKSKEKIINISNLIKKYLKNVEEIEEPEKKEFEYNEHIINNLRNDLSGEWLLITLVNKGEFNI